MSTREEELSARTDKFLERACAWTPFTTELHGLDETEEGRSILLEAYSIYQEEA